MDNKGRFTPGDPRAGRPKGSLNRTSLYARELAQRLVTDPEYVASLKARLLDGKLGGDFERVLWAYAFGPPPQHPISVMGDFLEGLLSEEELREIDTTLS